MSRTNGVATIILCLTFGASIGLAQGVYITGNAGYGLGAGTQALGSSQTSSPGGASSFEGVYGSFGEGFKFGTSAGYMFNKNLGVELGLSYWLGKTFEETLKSSGIVQTRKLSGSGFVAVPSIVFSANMETVSPYARFGLMVGILRRTKEEYRYEQGSLVGESTWEATGKLAIGYAGALGVVVPAGGSVDFFAEVALHSLTYSPGQLEITRYVINGVDQKASLTETQYTYEESYDISTPDVQLAVRRPFSSIGFAVGARINL